MTLFLIGPAWVWIYSFSFITRWIVAIKLVGEFPPRQYLYVAISYLLLLGFPNGLLHVSAGCDSARSGGTCNLRRGPFGALSGLRAKALDARFETVFSEACNTSVAMLTAFGICSR